jgi:hypothetical protein
VTDWSGHDGTQTSTRYREMARTGFAVLSPSYQRLSYGVADDTAVLALLDTLPPPKRQPNLLLGAVRFLGGPVHSYREFRTFVLNSWDELAATMSTRRTQTNEPRRCATLLPALTALPQPLALLEVGASAGLCLHPDRYAYRYDDRPVLGSSSVVLDCATSGPVPFPLTLPLVRWRAGLDLNPLDVDDDEEVRWLESLIWPEEIERFEILHRAVAIAREHPAPVHAGDLTTHLAALAATAPADATLVVFHSAVIAYLDDDARARFREQLRAVAGSRPLVWLSNEAPGITVDTAVAPGWDGFVLARDDVPLALTGGHGDTLKWWPT